MSMLPPQQPSLDPSSSRDGKPASKKAPLSALGGDAAGIVTQLEHRLALFRRMSESVLRARQAIVEQNLEGILETTTEQQSLVGELRRLLSQSAAVTRSQGSANPGQGPAETPQPADAQIDLPAVTNLCQKLVDAQRDLRFATQVNEILLQRSNNAAAALRNLYVSYSGTYEDPRGKSGEGKR